MKMVFLGHAAGYLLLIRVHSAPTPDWASCSWVVQSFFMRADGKSRLPTSTPLSICPLTLALFRSFSLIPVNLKQSVRPTQQTNHGVIMQHLEEVKNILSDVLSLGERKNALKEDSLLLGDLPELDSMAVVNVIT